MLSPVETCGICLDKNGSSRHENFECECKFPICDECFEKVEKKCVICKNEASQNLIGYLKGSYLFLGFYTCLLYFEGKITTDETIGILGFCGYTLYMKFVRGNVSRSNRLIFDFLNINFLVWFALALKEISLTREYYIVFAWYLMILVFVFPYKW